MVVEAAVRRSSRPRRAARKPQEARGANNEPQLLRKAVAEEEEEEEEEEEDGAFHAGDSVIEVCFYECRSGGDIFAKGLKLDLTKRTKILTSTISCPANVGEHGDVGWGHISYSIPTDEHERIHTALGMDECGIVE